jgi:DNA-binding CsgD family transcriptional regulator
MLITANDIADMASPGWECGSDFEVEALEEGFGEADVLEDDYSELDLSDTRGRGEPEPEAEPEPEGKPIRYIDGCRDGLTTLEICTRLKNERMTEKNTIEQEFAAIRRTYPENGADLKILMWLASGFSYRQAGDLLERSEKTIRNAARRLRQFRDHGTVKFLPAHLVQVGEDLWKPFPPVRSGRPRKAKTAAPVQAPAAPEIKATEIMTVEITTAEIINFDLFGQPVQPRKRRQRKVATVGVRRVRVRPTVPGQLEMSLGKAA